MCQPSRSPLVVFHVDMNSVALREAYLRKWLQKASAMGYNGVLWEIEDKIAWETCPECVSPDAFSKKTFREILAYARSLGLEPVPLLQTVGHAEYVLQHEKYFSFREDPSKYDCYATCKPGVRRFIKRWIDEYLDLFGEVRYFHLGGDEAYEFATSPECQAEMRNGGKGKLYADYIADIAQPLLKRGIRPCIWGDQILHYPEAVRDLPKGVVIWDWNYSDGDTVPASVTVWDRGKRLSRAELTPEDIRHFPEIIDSGGNLRAFYTADALKRLGYDVVLCSSARSSGDAVFAVRQSLHAENIVGAARKTVEWGLLGTCVTSWAVRIPSYESQQMLLCLAPLTVRNATAPLAGLRRMCVKETFGTPDQAIMDATEQIGMPFPFVDGRTTGIQWTGMKDSRPAPPGYIRQLIGKWKSENGGAEWTANSELIRASSVRIEKGVQELNVFLPSAKKGFDVLDDWQSAGFFMSQGSLIAGAIVAGDGARDSLESDGSVLRRLHDLRREYKRWLGKRMTPRSAETSAGLVYDALIDYFEHTQVDSGVAR